MHQAGVLPTVLPTSVLHYWGVGGLVSVYMDAVKQRFTLGSRTTTLLLGASKNARRTESVDILFLTIVNSLKISFGDHPIPAISCKG